MAECKIVEGFVNLFSTQVSWVDRCQPNGGLMCLATTIMIILQLRSPH